MKGFLRAGHTPTLVAALLYFDVSFMAWVLLGPLAPFLRAELGLSATEQGLVTAIPLLGGSLFRPLLGMLGERIGGRRTGLLGLVLTLITLAAGWQFAHTTAHFYVLGFFLGIAGASFAVALPLASRWYPPEYQGLAMGIAGAGNSGTLLATLFAPRLSEQYGWQATFGIAIAPIAVVLVLFVLLARDSPRRPTPATLSDYAAVVREGDTLSLALLYSLTFGGFVGFASFLTTFFHEGYHVSRVDAGDLTTVVVVAGSLLRPVGGWFSDRVGGYRVLVVLLAGFAACIAFVGTMRWSQGWDVSAVQRAGVYSYRTPAFARPLRRASPLLARRHALEPKMSYLAFDHTQTSCLTLLSSAGRVCIFKRTCPS